ncbi:transposase family protein [Actinomyces sp. HPA0247]|uniref:transposase family protein n=1 Tax=Actinomyces sp. HPA0247 TaxID=1203556 RepID=UPI000A0276C1|nr:transposase family protein [Actinomyces sp. HPA0247]
MSVARTPQALVLDVESCNQLVGCPGCGVIAHGHGRVVVEVIDAPSAGVPARIRCHKRRWICREHTCETVTFLVEGSGFFGPFVLRGLF